MFPLDPKTRTAPHGDPLRAIVFNTRAAPPHHAPSHVHTYRVAIESSAWSTDTDNVVRKLDHLRPDAILDAAVWFGYGVGEWGTQRALFIETATPNASALEDWVIRILGHAGQTCAYVNIDGAHAFELNHNGEWSPITGR